MHHFIKIGGVFPSFSAAFLNQFRAQFADAGCEGFIPARVLDGYIADDFQRPSSVAEQRANAGEAQWIPTE